MNVLKKLFSRPVTICTIVVVCFGLGIMAVTDMDVNLLPEMSYPALGITVAYPGASAETCDEDVRPLMENTLKTTNGIKSLTTMCIENASIAVVMFDYDTDLDKKMAEIEDKFKLVQFPSACYDPIYLQVDFNGLAVATVTVCNPDDPQKSYEAAEELRTRFLAVENVGSVTVTGMPEDSITIRPIKGLESVILLIAQTLQTNGQLDIPLGNLVFNGETVSFRNDSEADDIDAIRKTPMEIPLTGDLATALTTAKRLLDYVSSSSADELENTKGEIERLYSLFEGIDPEGKTDDELLGEIAAALPLENLPENLKGTVYEIILNALRDSGDIKGRLADIIAGFDEIIAMKRGLEESGAEPTAADYKAMLDIFVAKTGIDVPMEISEDLVGLLTEINPDEFEYEQDGSATFVATIEQVAEVVSSSSNSSYAYYNSKPAVTIEVYGISGANTTAISEEVKKILASSDDLGAEAILLDDTSSFINDSITNVLSSMLIGGLLAVLVIYLFLRRVRTSVIIAITMPLSVLLALICMYFMGITLNMVSLGGLAVGIGMLVDNSIVVIESITCERDKGKTAIQAAVDGTRLVMGSLIASTLTSVCVFFPILFTKGLTKMIFTDMSWSVIFSLTFSLIVAVTVIPTLYCLAYGDKLMLSGKLFKAEHARAERLRQKQERRNAKRALQGKPPEKGGVMGTMMRMYDKLLRGLLKRRWLVLTVAVVLFGASTYFAFATGIEFMPSVDQRTIEVKVTFSPSDNMDYCQETSRAVYDAIQNNVEGIKHLSLNVGKAGLVATSPSGTIRIILEDDGSSTKEAVARVREVVNGFNLRSSVTEVDGVLASLMSGMGGISSIAVSVAGEDINVLEEIYAKVKDKALADYDYFKTITHDATDTVTEYRLVFDKEKCLKNGVDYMVAVGTLRAGIAGFTACTATENGKTVNVNVIFDENTITCADDLRSFVLGLHDGAAVTVADVCTEINETQTRTAIKKENGKYILSISAEAQGVDAGTAGKTFKSVVAEVVADYEGYTYSETGVNFYLNEVFQGLIVSIIVSFLLLFAVMACQFESLKKPFIVIFAIPFSFTGGFLALALTGMSLNVVSFVGLIMLMGVVVNDAIVMIDRIGQFEADGMNRYDALIEGSKSRMRAIWMTTLTTVLALVPLALGIGKGAELMQPLGIVVIGGLTLATLVTLVLIPTVYSLVNRVPIERGDSETVSDGGVSDGSADNVVDGVEGADGRGCDDADGGDGADGRGDNDIGGRVLGGGSAAAGGADSGSPVFVGRAAGTDDAHAGDTGRGGRTAGAGESAHDGTEVPENAQKPTGAGDEGSRGNAGGNARGVGAGAREAHAGARAMRSAGAGADGYGGSYIEMTERPMNGRKDSPRRKR